MIYKRDPITWTAGLAGKTPLRSWMSRLNVARVKGAMFFDFGYWKGAWQSQSRPGPFVVAFVPVWLIGLMMFGIFLAFDFGFVRFRLRTILIAMTLAAGLLYLATLRSRT